MELFLWHRPEEKFIPIILGMHALGTNIHRNAGFFFDFCGKINE
ncbi:hypothetical protein A33Q_2098 [Indibacter alkaliphilus LW1]|uniref:Uncharacterized protein n=1 Tax=Indibacter alkaliphilus (strain CCUG 57479 / KCTC 22604 / LW1) TaxID=1189612 RepID=S2E3L4_INDAL|nr:hypothetical protein A33Q_2098 [Indibacter alkaliphilus LW1]